MKKLKYIHYWPLLLVLFMAAKCPKSLTGPNAANSKRLIPDNSRRETGGDSITRLSGADDCRKIDPRAQNIFIQWGRDRKREGYPLDVDLAAKMLGVASWESGGRRGLGVTNISPHRAESCGNGKCAGDDGITESHVSDVEGYLNNPSKKKFINHQMNFGMGQLSPDVFNGYPAAVTRLKAFASRSNPDEVFASCISDIGFTGDDHGAVKNQLSSLMNRRDEIDSWVSIVGRYSRKFGRGESADRRARAACNADPACVDASLGLGRWLLYCPRLNLEVKEIVYKSNKNYFAKSTRRAPPVCRETLQAEINKYQYNNPDYYFVDNGSHKLPGALL
ncbi:MAG: hypothetical protein R3A80_02060 [Bdellovibrionota bacterium]